MNGRSRFVLDHRLLNLSFNTTLDVTKQLELYSNNLPIVDQGWFEITDCQNPPFNMTFDVYKQLELSWKNIQFQRYSDLLAFEQILRFLEKNIH